MSAFYRTEKLVCHLCVRDNVLDSYEVVLKQSHAIFPDYMMVFVVAVLAHCPQFTDPTDVDQLTTMKSCLWFVMEPLITKNDSYCFSFYKGMLDRLKTVKDALEPDNEVVNEVNYRTRHDFRRGNYPRLIGCDLTLPLQKIYALSDLALTILLNKTVNFDMKDVLTEIKISGLFFKKVEDPLFVNDKCYLPPELQYQPNKRVTKK